MTDHNEPTPTSTFDEICHLTIVTMYTMDMDRILDLRDQVTSELNRAKLAKACLDSALLLKTAELKANAAQDPDQPSLLEE